MSMNTESNESTFALCIHPTYVVKVYISPTITDLRGLVQYLRDLHSVHVCVRPHGMNTDSPDPVDFRIHGWFFL